MKRKYQSNKILKEIIEGSSSNTQRREGKKQTNENKTKKEPCILFGQQNKTI